MSKDKPSDAADSPEPSTPESIDVSKAVTANYQIDPTRTDDDASDIPIYQGTVQVVLTPQPGSKRATPPPLPPETYKTKDIQNTIRLELPVDGDAPPDSSGRVTTPISAESTERTWMRDDGQFATGGMSLIHKVQHQNLRRTAAMKILRPEYGKDETNRRRFLEEAQITGQLDHPNIPPIYDLWVGENGEVRFTMKLVEGETLSDLLDRRLPGQRSDKDWTELVNIYVKVCDALSFAHSYGVIHRDLKAENVMVGSHGQVWLMDWGCAFLLPKRSPGAKAVSVDRDPSKELLDAPNTILGTAGYMAPEQSWARVEDMDEVTDVYLLGALLFEILTNCAPHPGPSLAQSVLRAQRGEVDDPNEIAGDAKLPPELCRIAMKSLSTKRDDRFQSVDEVKSEIEESLRNGWWFNSLTFPVGSHVVREGDDAKAAYIITKGTCEVYRMENGKKVFLRQMGPGDTFGEMAIFTKQVRTASVEVTEELTATVITIDAFDRAMGKSWMRPFVMGLAERFKDLDDRFTYLRSSEESNSDS